LHSKETNQYIRKLEGETERLGKLVKDINAQLHASKVRVCAHFLIGFHNAAVCVFTAGCSTSSNAEVREGV
jgi:hypothetical protein